MGKIETIYQHKFKGRYGSRKGFIRACWHKLLFLLGVYNKYRHIDWGRIDRLVFVCKGNICRSAFAEAVASSQGIPSVSCGLSTKVGAPANAAAKKTANRRGIDLCLHRTTPIGNVMFRKSDLLIAMEPSQAESLEALLASDHFVTLLGLWWKPRRPHLQDPYGFSEAYFDNCFEFIEKSVVEIGQKIKSA